MEMLQHTYRGRTAAQWREERKKQEDLTQILANEARRALVAFWDKMAEAVTKLGSGELTDDETLAQIKSAKALLDHYEAMVQEVEETASHMGCVSGIMFLLRDLDADVTSIGLVDAPEPPEEDDDTDDQQAPPSEGSDHEEGRIHICCGTPFEHSKEASNE